MCGRDDFAIGKLDVDCLLCGAFITAQGMCNKEMAGCNNVYDDGRVEGGLNDSLMYRCVTMLCHVMTIVHHSLSSASGFSCASC